MWSKYNRNEKKVKMGLCRPYKRVNHFIYTRTVGELGPEQMKARVKAKMKNPEKIIGQQTLKNKKTLKKKEYQKIKKFKK